MAMHSSPARSFVAVPSGAVGYGPRARRPLRSSQHVGDPRRRLAADLGRMAPEAVVGRQRWPEDGLVVVEPVVERHGVRLPAPLERLTAAELSYHCVRAPAG